MWNRLPRSCPGSWGGTQTHSSTHYRITALAACGHQTKGCLQIRLYHYKSLKNLLELHCFDIKLVKCFWKVIVALLKGVIDYVDEKDWRIALLEWKDFCKDNRICSKAVWDFQAENRCTQSRDMMHTWTFLLTSLSILRKSFLESEQNFLFWGEEACIWERESH